MRLKMKKILIACFVLIVIIITNINCYATEDSDYFENYQKKYMEIIDSIVDENFSEYIDSEYLSEFSFSSIMNSSPKDIFNFFSKTADGTLKGPLRAFVIICGILLMVSIFFTYLPEDEKRRHIINIVASVIIVLFLCQEIVMMIKSASAVIAVSSKFMLMFLPVLAGIIAAVNNPMLALSYNSITLYFSQLLSIFAENFLAPLMGCFFAIITVSSLGSQLKLKDIASLIKSTTTKMLGVSSSLFVGVLSIKGILANTADTVAVKGAKLVVSTLVPVIGGSLSEAYGTITTSLGLVKSTVGIVGILAMLLINLPIIINIALWTTALSFASMLAEILDLTNIHYYLKSISDGLKTLNIIVIFSCMLFVVSTGILLTLKASV